jgi:hypothetical protein
MDMFLCWCLGNAQGNDEADRPMNNERRIIQLCDSD